MKREKNQFLVFYNPKFVFWLILALPFFGIAQNKSNKNEGRSKQLSIEAAQMSKESYLYAKMGYFANKLSLLQRNTDTAIYFIKESIISIDSAILLASDSELMAINLANLAKSEAKRAYKLLMASKNNSVVSQKQELMEEATLLAGNAVADAYHASFYFKDGAPPEKKQETIKDTTPKVITKLDIDQTLFALLDGQLLEKEEKNKSEIEKLTQKLKVTKDAAKTAKIKAEIKKLEKEEAEVEKEDIDAKEQLGKINAEIDARDKHIATTSSKNLETIFSKSLSIPADEWNKQVLLESEMPMGLVYQVQIGVYKNAVSAETFKGITPIFGKTTALGITYSAGIFEKATDAKQAKDYVLGMGLHDAFVVAYYNQKRITMPEAAKLEKK